MIPIKAFLPREASTVAQKLGGDVLTALRITSRLSTGEDLVACAFLALGTLRQPLQSFRLPARFNLTGKF